jgi:hypothetical protein
LLVSLVEYFQCILFGGYFSVLMSFIFLCILLVLSSLSNSMFAPVMNER